MQTNFQKIQDRLPSIEEDFAPDKYRGGFSSADLEYSKFAEYWSICLVGLNSSDQNERGLAEQFQTKIKEIQAREMPMMRKDLEHSIITLIVGVAKFNELDYTDVDVSGAANENLVIVCPSIYEKRDLFIKTYWDRYKRFGFKQLFIREKSIDIGEIYRYDFDDTKPIILD